MNLNIDFNKLYQIKLLGRNYYYVFYFNGYRFGFWKIIPNSLGIPTIEPCVGSEKEELITFLAVNIIDNENIKPLKSKRNAERMFFIGRLTDFLNAQDYDMVFASLSYNIDNSIIVNYQMYSHFQNPTFQIKLTDLCNDLSEYDRIKKYIEENKIKGLVRIDKEEYGEIF